MAGHESIYYNGDKTVQGKEYYLQKKYFMDIHFL